MCTLRVMPVNENVLKTTVNPQSIIALYGDFNNKINVGYPAIAAYKPMYGNMWGYKEAQDKGLYIIIDDEENKFNSDIYEIDIDEERHVLNSFTKISLNDSETQVYNFNYIKKKKRAL